MPKRKNLSTKNLPHSSRKETTVEHAQKPSISCSICLDTQDQSSKKPTNCGHLFHEHCINEWLKNGNTCPVCRTKIVAKKSLTEETSDGLGAVVQTADELRRSLQRVDAAVLRTVAAFERAEAAFQTTEAAMQRASGANHGTVVPSQRIMVAYRGAAVPSQGIIAASQRVVIASQRVVVASQEICEEVELLIRRLQARRDNTF